MLFNSLHFLIFLPIVFLLYFRAKEREQKIILLVSSLYFYSALKLAFLPLLLSSLFFTYYTSLKIEKADKLHQRRFWLIICLVSNLSLLLFFKYTDFLRSIYYDSLYLFGLRPSNSFQALNLVLPLGISFYTFQAIAYAVDVYRRQIPSEKNFFKFTLFLVFFPQLVAGPIIRASVLIPQFLGRKEFKRENFITGMEIMALGFFKKTIVADPLSGLIDPVYADPASFNGISNILAMALFSIQIYCDFSGYSDIAIGTGKILGFYIPENFRRPFLAASNTEIWTRWHISLSSWLKDYIYISLGGNRVSQFRNYYNLMITMVIGGIWHGAAWTFFFWGLLHAVFLAIERFFIGKGWSVFFQRIPRPIGILYTFSLFSLGALFFRSKDMGSVMISLQKAFTFADGKMVSLPYAVLIPVALLIIYEIFEESSFTIPKTFFYETLKNVTVLTVLILCFLIYSVTVSPQFYYFQF